MAVTIDSFARDMDRINKDLEVVGEKLAPQALVMAGNVIIRKAKTRLVGEVWSTQPPEVLQRHVAKRIFTRNMSLKHPYGRMTSYITDMPAIALSEHKGVNKTLKGTDAKAYTFEPRRNAATKKQRREGTSAFGVKVGKKYFNRGFIQKTRADKGNSFHVFVRPGKTWGKGNSGWNHPKDGAPRDLRAEFVFQKYDFRTPFLQHHDKAMHDAMDRHFEKEFKRSSDILLQRAFSKA